MYKNNPPSLDITATRLACPTSSFAAAVAPLALIASIVSQISYRILVLSSIWYKIS